MSSPLNEPPVPSGGAHPSLPRVLLLALIGLAIEGLLLAVALGGLRPLLAHAPALALLAIWTSSNAVLAWTRPVGRQDVTAGAADAPLVMLALFLLPLFAAPVSALGERLGLANAPWHSIPALAADAVVWAGVLLTAIGLTIRIAAMKQLGARFSPRIAVQRGHVLETGGLYARVRHPGYLGALLATLGGVLAFRSMLAWPLFALMYVAQSVRARREEALLETHFGEPYQEYRRHAGRFLPGPGPG